MLKIQQMFPIVCSLRIQLPILSWQSVLWGEPLYTTDRPFLGSCNSGYPDFPPSNPHCISGLLLACVGPFGSIRRSHPLWYMNRLTCTYIHTSEAGCRWYSRTPVHGHCGGYPHGLTAPSCCSFLRPCIPCSELPRSLYEYIGSMPASFPRWESLL